MTSFILKKIFFHLFSQHKKLIPKGCLLLELLDTISFRISTNFLSIESLYNPKGSS